MNRLAFSTLPCEGRTLDEMLELAVRWGFGGLELREGASWGISTEMTAEARRSALRSFERAGVRATDIASGVCLAGLADDAAQLENLRRSVRLAHDLEAGGVRVFLGYFTERRDQDMPAIPYEALVAHIASACDDAAPLGVPIWIETHNEFATGRSLRKLLDDVRRDNCAVIYDIIHPLEEGEQPEETVALLGAQCVHVHVKDGVPFEDPLRSSWKYTRIGEGQVPIASVVETLERAGYAGSYSLEWETKWRPELQVPGMAPETVFPDYVAKMRDLLERLKK
ncbi:sugar phosphate isomerase/epimerase family protein [Cohnella sp. GCM10020058]|uniref:sugar phosphate isomerase/epimerase family protein n=1 Tax=Cohnella sp. GCM10020058 TaxID=3317330 RepID=UPI003631FC26